MYKRIVGACCLFAASLGMQAQSPLEKGLQSISQDKAEAIVEFLADDNLLGREAGQRESSLSRHAPWSGSRKDASRCIRIRWHG